MIYNIKDYGAIPDGKTLNTKAIQEAIDTCHKKGGGQVLVENGLYKTAPIKLRSNVELHIAANATLLGSDNREDFGEWENVKHVDSKKLPRWRNASFIFADEAENIAITGMGRIDCSGDKFVEAVENPTYWSYRRIDGNTPPRVIFLAGCRNVKIEDLTVLNQPAGWCIWIHDCDYVSCDKLKIESNVEYPNNDGIHINSSRNVTVSNCDITSGDDSIIVRANNSSLKENKVCEKVTITNCSLTSYSGGIRIGWVNDGVIKNCTFSNIVMTDTSIGIDITLPYIASHGKVNSSSDRGREDTLIENLSFNNIIMDAVYGEPVKIQITDNTGTRVNAIRNLYFSNLHTRGPRGIQIKGRADNHPDNIRFSDCTFEITDYSPFNGREYHGGQGVEQSHGGYPKLQFCDKVIFNNVEFINKL